MDCMRILAVAALGLIPPLASAQDTAAATTTAAVAAPQTSLDVLDNRWSLWPSVGAILSDSSDLDAGFSGGLKLTRPLSDHGQLEVGADYSNLETTRAGDYERISARLGGSLFLGKPYYDSASDFQPFLGLGAHVSSIEFLGQRTAAYGPYASLGAQQRLGDFTMLLLEGRYQIDYLQDKGVITDSNFYTWQVMASLRIPLGEKPYDASRDSDGDGVPDARDECPNTPAGVQVYSNGCPVDTDGDGVPDYLDKCPNTPRGMAVDANGCPTDSDGDGVPDHLDKCPNTPAGVAVDANGCPIDSDGDGVPDYLDKCPNTPQGTVVTADGCPANDADGDGIADHLDRCPDTPPGVPVGPDGCPLDSDGDGIPDYLDECPKTPPGSKVLPNGCALKGDCRRPRPGEQVDANGCAVDQNFILKGVKFEFDSDRLTPQAREILNDVAATLQSYSGVNVDLEGHTDDIGSDSYNLGLSERRANAVKTYLVGRGVGAKRMNPVGYGESRPIDTNASEPGRENNRRVELKVLE
jgi:OOP family OmpA-OmpF porin